MVEFEAVFAFAFFEHNLQTDPVETLGEWAVFAFLVLFYYLRHRKQ